jgi:hypothetical protein
MSLKAIATGRSCTGIARYVFDSAGTDIYFGFAENI